MTQAPEDLEDLRRDLGRAMSLLNSMRPEYVKAREFYDGTRAEVFAGRTVEKIIGETAKYAPISMAHIPVDVIADKVDMASLTATGRGAEALATIVDANDLEDEADDIILKACYYGDYYTIIDPREEDDEGAIALDGVGVVGSSPLTTIVVYDSKDSRTKLYGAKVWERSKGKWAALLYYDNVTVKLKSTLGGSDVEAKAEDFELDVDETNETASAFIPHEGGRMLIEHFPVLSKPYGTPVHRKAWGPQDAITKVSAVNLANVDAQGFTSRWALADPMAEIDDDIDDDFGEAGPPFAGEAPSDGISTVSTGSSRVKAIPGAISLLRGIREVGQFEPTATEHFLKNLDWYVRAMAVATGVPLFEFDLSGEQPSGEARRRAEARVNKRAKKIAGQAAAFFEAVAGTALAVAGITDATVKAAFTPVETATDKEGIELIGLKTLHGVPMRQALLEAGYTDEQVDEWWPADAPAVGVDMLRILAAALAQLGQAKTLGVITDEELVAMLPELLTGARGEGPAPVAVTPGVIPAA